MYEKLGGCAVICVGAALIEDLLVRDGGGGGWGGGDIIVVITQSHKMGETRRRRNQSIHFNISPRTFPCTFIPSPAHTHPSLRVAHILLISYLFRDL